MSVTVSTQAELDAALKAGEALIIIDAPSDVWITLTDTGTSRVVALDSSRVEAWDSSRVEAWGSSRVEARDSSRVVAWGSSTVEAWDSSTVEALDSSRVEAWDSSRVEARDSSTVEAGRYTAVWLHSQRVTLDAKGATIDMTAIDPSDPATWCDLKGVAVTDGKALVYKAVDADLTAGHRYTPTTYPIGGTVTAPDWRADRSCGHGLHFSPTPCHALAYYRGDGPARYLACEVALNTLVPLNDKCKAPTARVLREVDEWGDPVEAVQA